MIRNGLLTLAILAALAAPAPTMAQSIEDGFSALEAGNYEQAYEILHRHALDGDATAQFMVGELYLWGNGVEEDFDEHVRWIRLAAEQGHAQA